MQKHSNPLLVCLLITKAINYMAKLMTRLWRLSHFLPTKLRTVLGTTAGGSVSSSGAVTTCLTLG